MNLLLLLLGLLLNLLKKSEVVPVNQLLPNLLLMVTLVLPRKSVVDGTGVISATSSKSPSKKVCGRNSCSKRKKQRPEASRCILSGVGVLCKVTLRRSETVGGTMTHEGQFDITSLSGSYIRSKSGVTGFLNLSVTSPDGDFEQPKSKAPSSTPPPNLLNFGPPVTKAASSSQVPQPTFEGQAM
ncbi:AT-hook motif nuclear-localized protein 4 [Capsicum chinense]|nr:AT-hook motif nuclear-localized protein 4 [Capsicum chinense]